MSPRRACALARQKKYQGRRSKFGAARPRGGHSRPDQRDPGPQASPTQGVRGRVDRGGSGRLAGARRQTCSPALVFLLSRQGTRAARRHEGRPRLPVGNSWPPWRTARRPGRKRSCIGWAGEFAIACEGTGIALRPWRHFERSLAVARRQRAEGFRPARGGYSLARLGRDLGEPLQAAETLQQTYNGFTRGPATPDLKLGARAPCRAQVSPRRAKGDRRPRASRWAEGAMIPPNGARRIDAHAFCCV